MGDTCPVMEPDGSHCPVNQPYHCPFIHILGLYQLFAFVLMVRRHGEAKEYLEPTAIPVSLEDCIDVTYGNSAYVAIIGFVVAMFAGTFWIVHTNILRRAIKLYISETKYNLWCRM